MQTSTRTSTHIVLILFVLMTLIVAAPAQAKTWKIMPVGDSITKGEQSTDSTGFRKILFDKLDASGVDFEFVGDDIGPDDNLNYRGFFESGAKIDYFLPGGTKDLMAQLDKNNADIVLIHLGTNNMNKDAAGPYTNPNTASGKLYSLLNDLTQRTDLSRIVVCKIIPKLDDYGQVIPKIHDFNAQIEQMFFDNFANDIVTLADMNSIIDVNTQISIDNIHPNDSGYQQMANMYSYIIQGLGNNGGLVHADTEPPAKIYWSKGESLEESAYLEWTVPADDGSNGDRANLYELRYSTNELDDNNFSQGTLVSRARPGEPGSTDSATIDGLVAGLTYHFAIRAYDEHNNKSILSDDIPVSISEPGREVCDNFSDPSLLNWQVNPAYQVLNDELVNTSSSPGWNYLAIFTEATYNTNAGNVNASFTWSNSADVDGINATGIAMLLDKKDYNSANGYLVRIRQSKVYLEAIVNGQPQTPQLQVKDFDTNAPDPQPGDTLRISYAPSTTNGYVFNVYINKNWVGQVNDSNETYGQADHLYSGVMLYGNMNNNIDNFCVSVPPLPADRMAIHGGDGIPGTVTEKLSEPLSVKVMDVNGIGVQDIQVEFTVQSGDAFLSTDSLEFDDQIWVEAESGTLIDPMINFNDGGASGNAYISTPVVNGNYDNGLGKYKIYFPAAGSYNLWLRYYAPDGDQNSCWYAIEGIADTTRWDFIHVYATWAWDAVGPFTIPQGFVDFTIKNREPGTRIDKILFTKNLSYQPSGEGGTSPRLENITDASGIAYTELTFGEQAGQVQVQAYAPSVPKDNTQIFTVSSSATDPNSMDYVDAGKKILTGTTGQPLNEDFSVFVQDQYQNPNNGVPVTFTVVSGDGYFDNSDGKKISKTVDGVASARLVLGASAETKVIAELKDYPNIPPLDFYGRIPSDELASKITKTTTATLQGQVKTTLNDSLKVQILNDSDQPVSGYNVNFNVTGGGGTLNGSNTAVTIPTNAGGYAAVAFTLGDTAGVDNQIVRAEGSTALNGAPITFTASAVPGQAAKLVYDSGNNQEQYAGQTFAEPLKVKVTDDYNNGIEGHNVTFTVQIGNGNFAGKTGITVTNADTTLTTNSQGIAQVNYTAGSDTGLNQVQATASGLSPGTITFDSLNVLAPQAASIQKISGDSPVQKEQVLQTLDSPFKIKVLDTFGNAVSSVDVVFKPQADSAKINGQDSLLVKTNAQGEAEAKLTLGTISGRQETRVYIKNQPDVDAAVFYADADPGPAAEMVAASDTNFTGIAGRDTVTLRVRITDQYGNAVPGESVQYYRTYGNGQFDNGQYTQSDTSDNFGNASVKFIMGTNSAIIEKIHCTANYLSGSSINFHGTVLPDSADTIAIISGQNQEKSIQSELAPMVVEVRDKYGNSVAKEPVVFEAFSESGKFKSDSLVVSDGNGRAQVTYQLGTKAGDKSDTVQVSLKNRHEISNIFYATATPGAPEKIAAASDTLWPSETLGAVAIQLAPKVKVTDNYGNPVSGIQVSFQPTSSVDPSLPKTGADGIASVTWTLSTSPDTNKVTASAKYEEQPLKGSPVSFMAITVAGNPTQLKNLSPLSSTGYSTLKVQVLDENDHGVKNQPVIFKKTFAQNSGGKFVTETDTLEVDSVQVYSDQDGMAQIGYIPAIGTNQVVASCARIDPPFNLQRFTITGVPPTATQIRLLNSLPLSATVNDTIKIKVEALDSANQKVAAQSLSFRIISGEGKLSESNTSTDENGIGQVIWRLGTTAGQDNNRLQVSAKDESGAHLIGSPDTLIARALAGEPFPDSCSMEATDNIVADGTASSAVTITLVDQFGNPVPNKTVMLKSDSANVTFTQPIQSNASGLAYGSVKSTKADSIYVYATVSGSPEINLHGIFIRFIPGDASQLLIFAGNNQPGNAGAVLKDSLAVLAQDQNENPVPGAAVHFQLKQGGGYFLNNHSSDYTATADADGIVSVRLVAKNQVNSTYLVNAQLPGISSSIVPFSGQIREPRTPFTLIKMSPDTLTGQAGEVLDEPLALKVLDADQIPVANQAIDFKVGTGTTGEITSANPASTNYLGVASVTYKLGKQSGAQIIKAELNGSTEYIIFKVIAQSGKPVSITGSSATESTVGRVVPLTVTITDSAGIGVPGLPVNFTVTEGAIYKAKIINNFSLKTNSIGKAVAIFQLGEKVGDYTVRAESDSLPGKWVDFHINAVHDKADSLKIHSGNGQYMEKGQWLNDPVVVQVTDRFGNPVQDHVIYFPSTNVYDSTDVNGLAESLWKIGPGDSSELYAMSLSGSLHPDHVKFVAYGVDNHFPDFDGLPAEITLDYTSFYENDSTFTMKIEAIDADGNPVNYTILDIPTDAKFDTNTHIFSWKPGSPNYKGIWTLRIKAEDNVPGNAHGVRIYTLKLNVTGNLPPKILGTNPPIESGIVEIDSLECKPFTVTAFDLDSDPLTFTWEVDGIQQASEGNSFTMCSKDWPGIHYLRCYVSDNIAGHEVHTDEWIIDKVELSSFSATSEPYKGIIIDWSTASESGNLGFNILRSLRENGTFEKLNTKIIPRREDGSYSYSDTSAAAGVKYYYKLEDVSTNGYRSEHGPISVQVSAPDHFALLQNYPNPFNPQTSIRFQLPQPAETKLIIFNYLGQQVRTLIKSKIKAGYHEIIWDGRNNAGLRVSSGIYYYRIIAGDFKATKKMVLIK